MIVLDSSFYSFNISIFPLAFVKDSGHPPLPIRPFSESPPMVPVEVTGKALEIWPKEVRAVNS